MSRLLSSCFLSLTPIWRWGFFITLAFAIASGVHAEQPPKKEESKATAPLLIHMISGSNEYASEVSLRGLKLHLEENYQVTCAASWAEDGAQDLENLDALADAELLVVFARRLKLPESQMELIRTHWQSGKPVIGIRTAGHAFQKEDNLIFDRKVLGTNYQGHYGNEPVTVTNIDEHAEHPVLEGVGPFVSSKLYKAGELADGAVPLQRGDNGKAVHPVTVVHQYRGGRMFFTSLGVPDDFENKNFRRMLVNAVFWTTHRNREKMAEAGS